MSKYYEKIAESSSYNLLAVYLTFICGIINTFIIARLLTPQDWALIILTLSFINIAIFFCNLFPPNAQDSIKYYIPHITSEEKGELAFKRSFIFHIYKIRLLSSILILISYLLVINFASFPQKFYNVILIMAPMIFFNVILLLNSSILLAFQKFKAFFLVSIVSPIIIVIFNSIVFLFKLEEPLYLISMIYLGGSLISCIISMLFIIPIIPSKKECYEFENQKKYEFYEIHKKYGFNLILANVFSLFTGLCINIIFLKYGQLSFITYLTICQISTTSALLFSSSNPGTYVSIFSELNYEKNRDEFIKLFKNLSVFLMIFNSIVIAVMEFFIVIYIAVIYSETYLVILIPIQIYLFSAFAKMIINNYLILTYSTNNTRINAEFNFIEMITNIFITFIAMTFFDFYILIILYVINSFFMTIVMFILIRIRTKIRTRLFVFYKPFLVFIVSFLVIFILSPLINFQLFDKAYLNYILNGSLKFVIFLLLFYIIIYFTKLITKKDFIQLVKLIPILNSKIFLMRKIVKMFSKFLPSE